MSMPTLMGPRAALSAQSTLRQARTLASQSRRVAVGVFNIKHQQQQFRLLGSLPKIAQSSFWRLIIPKPLRRGDDGTSPVAKAASDIRKAKEWNPATFYIFFFLFIGSMAIQMITLKKDFNTFMRQSEVKIGLLKEVVERIQKGETVDVERMLGTGDPGQEAEWNAVLKEIQRDETSRTAKRRDKATADAATAPPSTTKSAPSPPATPDSPSTGKAASITSFY